MMVPRASFLLQTSFKKAQCCGSVEQNHHHLIPPTDVLPNISWVCVCNILCILQLNQLTSTSAFTVQDFYYFCETLPETWWPIDCVMLEKTGMTDSSNQVFFICKSEEQLYLPLYLLGGLDETFTKFQCIAELWVNIL